MRDNIGKYRGQRKDGKGWVYGFLNSPNRIMVWDNEVCMRSESYEVIPETVGEFTGLKDKRKNQDLYAGDRVVIGGDRGVLVWDELELCWSLQIEDDEYQSLCRFYSYEEMDAVEYINNIHEEKP